MKLTLSHADVTLALCEFLATRGMTAFDPSKVTADFAFKRGSKELLCELDTEPKAPAEAAPVVAKATVVAPVTEALAPVVETPAEVQTEAQVETAAEVGADVAGSDADNLFD